MERTTFLKNYRIRLGYDGKPHEPDRKGPAVNYAAMDERTAEPVSVTLVPAENINRSEREQFEENALAAQKLRHVNVVKVLDFGREGDDYVYVSERLAGETLASWVRNHGPMPADAALRVAEQVVSVLSSAGFHRLPYPSIQPIDIMLVPGQTAEGSWPLVKVTSFGLPQLMASLESSVAEPDMQTQPGSEEQVTSIEQFSTKDIRAEIYSLGITLYFLLSGVALSAEALQHGLKFSGFPKPLRALLRRMLHWDPDRRPKDLIVVTELIRGALEKIERRHALSDRYGIPLKTAVTRQTKAPSRRLLRTAVALGLLLALAAAIAPMVFPDSIGKMLGLNREPKPVGVLIGVRESSPPPRHPAVVAQAPQNDSRTAPAVAASQPANPSVAPQTQAPTNAETQRNPSGIRPADVQQAQIANAEPEVAAAPTDSAQNSPGATLDTSPSADTAGNASAQENVEPPTTTASRSSSQGEKKSVTSTYARPRAAQSSKTSPHGRRGSVRSRVVGITADGRLILRLSSGRTAIVAPDEDATPRHRNRVFSDRDETSGPPSRFGPDYFPDD